MKRMTLTPTVRGKRERVGAGNTTLRLTVVNPADNSRLELEEVSPDETPARIIDGLVRQGFLPRLPAGRGYVTSVRGNGDLRQLDSSRSLAAGGVPSGATLQFFASTQGAAIDALRLERLRGDAIEMARARGPLVDWRAEHGKPPSGYVVTYRLPSYVTPWFTRRGQHRVRFDLPPAYPLAQPAVRLLDRPAVFHPNIFPDGRICLGRWSPEEGLAFVVLRVAKMLLYDPSVTNGDHPANARAAQWYETHRTRFPLLKDLAFPDPLARHPDPRCRARHRCN